MLLFTTIVFFTSVSLDAAALSRKTDIISFYNGDKLTGEIKGLYAGLLELSTDAMGTIKIEWQEISKIESQHHHEVRLALGKRFYGKINKSERPGEVIVSGVDGKHEVPALEIVEMRPVAETFKDRIDLYLSVGASYTKASSLGTGSINTDISYETEQTRNALSGRMAVTDTDSDITRSSKIDLTRSVWTNREDTYRVVLGAYESNDELAVDYRFSGGGGLGRYFIDTQYSTWSGVVGLQVITEKSVLGDKQDSVEAILNTEYSIYKYSTPELHFKINFSLFPSLTESGRLRGNSDIKFKWEIVEDLFWDITAFGSYDNKAAEDTQFDYGITTGVGWNY